jgi:outer membrane protein assembly factor BamB
VPVAASQLAGASHKAPKPPKYTWPKMAYSVNNSGMSPDPAISTANAAQLGVKWMVPTGTTDYSSPVVQWNAQLGETLVYQGNENGYLTAFNQANGATVWSDFLGSAIRDTPLVEGNYVWVADTFDPYEYKIDAATGAVECSTQLVSTENGSATIGAGPGGATTIYIAVNDLGTANGPLYAINEANCAVDWQYTTFNGNDAAGSWDPIAYATSATGVPMIVLGTADPDSSVYAIDAITGKQIWSFATLVNPTFSDDDVGAGASITPPGVNGFTDGVAYVPGKDGWMYALNLTTGAVIWEFNFGKAFDVGPEYSRATPCVIGDHVLFGGTMGLAELNAITGAPLWHTQAAGGGEVLSACAAVGPYKTRVVAVTDLSGHLTVLNAVTGAILYSYQMGFFSVASVADVDGNLLANSSDGFLYDFAVGGANSGAPTTAVTSPANGSTATNPDGDLTVSGTASGGPIAAVNVAIQEGGSAGPWWNGTLGTFTPGYFNNLATLSSPGGDSTNWSLSIPVPVSGGTYTVRASAAGTNGLADATADSSTPSPSQGAFTVGYLAGTPQVVAKSYYVAPSASLSVSGSGFGDAEKVAISLDGTTLATATTNSSGAFSSKSVAIPDDANFGVTSLVATGQTSGRTGNTAIDVSNEWLQGGYDSLDDAFEPNDLVLEAHVSPVSSDYLNQAWSYPSGAAIDDSATYYEDVLYFGNQAGTVTALDVRNSVPLWTYAAGSAVSGSPVVDEGLVIFGTQAGAVDALSVSTGALVWSTATSSAVDSSPAASGSFLAVGTTNGTVYGLDAVSGAVLWNVTLSGPIGPPVVDGAANELVVGAGDTITALGTSAGATLWQVTTGGPVTAYPSIFDGYVYVGSGDGKAYQLKESTGAAGWTNDVGGEITVGGEVSTFKGNEYVVGSNNGTVDFFNATKGNLIKTFNTGSAVVGVSGAAGFALVTSASGKAQGFKHTAGASFEYKAATAGFASAGTIVNGVVYLGGLDQTVRAFTIPGMSIP